MPRRPQQATSHAPAPSAQLVEQYVRLADGLPSSSPQTLADVAARLCCGERNARLLLARMQASGWLSWTPGRGRGRISTLTLRQDPGALRVRQLQRLLAQGQVEAAFSGLPDSAQTRIKEALPAFLGATPGGALRIPFYRPLHALDPQQVTRRTEAHLVTQLCDRLTAYDRETESLRPALAHHWESDDEGRRWRLWLRPGLRFQDGRPLRAQDVVATLLRLRDTPGPHRPLMAHVRTLTTQGQRIDAALATPDHLFLHRLAAPCCAILPEDDWHRPDFTTLPIGAGAFRLVRNNTHRATLAAFEGYWGERPLLDEIDLWVVPPGSEMPAVDLQLGASSAAGRASTSTAWRTLAQMEQGCDYVMLNPARPRFASAEARREIGHWLRSQVARTVLGDRFVSATGWLPGWKHLPAPSRRSPPPPALPRRLTLVTYQLDDLIALARCVKRACEAAGSTVELDVLSAPSFATQAWRSRADIVVAGEVLADDIAFGQYQCLAEGSNFHAWLGAGLKRRLATTCLRIAAEPDPARRLATMEEAFADLATAGAMLPMRHVRQELEHGPHLGGVSLARCGWMDFRKLWLPD